MRVLPIVISVLCIAIPAEVMARPKPKIAVAPLAGDSGNKVADAVVDALAGKDFTVVGPKDVSREMTKLGLSEELDARAARKLASKLGVVAVIDGKVSKAAGKRSLHLEVHRRGRPDAGFTVEFKSTTSKGFRRGVHAEITKKLEGAGDAEPADDDERPAAVADDGDRKRKLADDDGDRKRKLADDDGDRKRKLADDDTVRRKPAADDDGDRKRKLADDDTARRKPAADDDGDRKRKLADDDAARRPRKSADEGRRSRKVAAADDDGDDSAAVRKRKTRTRDEAAAPQLAARVGAGASVAQRQLSWDLRSGFTQIPPRVLTTAGGGRVDGEIYPLALADPSSSLAGLGLAAAYDKTFGLSIKVPNQQVSAPIDQSHYAVGVRYRFGVGEASSVAVGLDYARRKYVVERGGPGATLDAPDVDYAAIAPVASVRVPVAASIAVFGGADGLLILDAGTIQKSTSYGSAKVYGLEGTAGVDIAVTRQIGVRVAFEYSQIMFAFNPKGSTLANNRDTDPTTQDVNGATDRSMGLVATLGLVY